MLSKRSRACLTAGLCASRHLPSCVGFSASPPRTTSLPQTFSSGSGQARAGSSVVRSRATRVRSTADVEPLVGVAETTTTTVANPEVTAEVQSRLAAQVNSAASLDSTCMTFLRRIDPKTDRLEISIANSVNQKSLGVGSANDAIVTASGSVGTSGGVSGGNRGEAGVDASVVVAPPAEKPRSARRKRKVKEPELLEGDMLVDTPKMLALVYSSLGLNALYLLQALATIASPWQALCTLVGACIGYLVADVVSGVLHWSVDNYGNGDTPVWGPVIEAFQGHHASPWTITHRPFANNVHKIAYAVLPLLTLLRIVNPGPAGVAFGTSFLVGSLMSNEFHKYAHMMEPPAPVEFLQKVGVMVTRKEHGRHHSDPFETKYCIVSGVCNAPLDHFKVFRYMERVVYHLNGVEPIAWKLQPSLKAESLAVGWFPFDRAGVEEAAASSPSPS